MRILFTSDLHGKREAFERFAELLTADDYALGILGGDLIDEYRPVEEVAALLGVDTDALLDELPAADEDPVEAWRHSAEWKLQGEARERWS